MAHTIITIDRQFGSGGRELGRRVADLLGFAYYDKEILKEIVKKTEFSEEYIRDITEKGPISLFPITYSHSFALASDPNIEMAGDVYSAQTSILRDLAEKSNCVIIGRAAGYVLRDLNPIRIYVYSTLDSKIARCKERDKENMTEKQIVKMIKRVDKQRKRYYEFATGMEWGRLENYDLLVNTSNKDMKALARMVAHYFEEE